MEDSVQLNILISKQKRKTLKQIAIERDCSITSLLIKLIDKEISDYGQCKQQKEE